jgi:MoxR-like ATPase
LHEDQHPAPLTDTGAGVLPAGTMVAAARSAVVGRDRDIEVVAAALGAGRSVLLEGPPGTGKTTLLRALTEGAGIPLVVVEGNAELSPGRLIGHHDPSRLLADGYAAEAWMPGPLVDAMVGGCLLYVEELNRVPEETLNVLLGVLSERRIHIPRYGEVVAAPAFRLVAAMNPYDAVGTGRITPALYDRTCRVAVGYQDAAEETAIVARVSPGPGPLVGAAVRAVRATREHPDVRIGSSVRGALDLVAVAGQLGEIRGLTGVDAWRGVGLDAALAALTGRITRREGTSRTVEQIVADIWREAAEPEDPDPGKASGPGRTTPRTDDPRPAAPHR